MVEKEVISLKIIKDIRIYKSDIENVAGNSLPSSFSNKELNAVIHRIVMKLRENSFSLGEFDHLYVNFTNCEVDNRIALSKRCIDKYSPWYRYYDVQVSDTVFSQLETQISSDEIINFLENVLIKCFVSEHFDEKLIHSCFSEAIMQGEKMMMIFKEKHTSQRTAVVYLRYLDSGRYSPLLKVFNLNEKLLLETDLPETVDLSYLGEIQLSTKRVTIKPRKSSYTKAIEPIFFEY